MKRYEIYFIDCDSVLTTDSKTEAIRKARLNAGIVYDTETGETIANYTACEE